MIEMEHVKMIETDIDAGIDAAENIDKFLIGSKVESLKQETMKPKEKIGTQETRMTLRNRYKTLNFENKMSNCNRIMEISYSAQNSQLIEDFSTNQVKIFFCNAVTIKV